MTPELGLFLAILALFVGGAVWLVRLGGRSSDADHAEDQLDEQQESDKARSKWRGRGGSRRAYLDSVPEPKAGNDELSEE